MPPFRNCSVSQKKPRCPGGMKWGPCVTVPADPAFKPPQPGASMWAEAPVWSQLLTSRQSWLCSQVRPQHHGARRIPTVAAPAPDPRSPQHDRVTLCLVWVGYAATDRRRGCQAWLQTFTPAVPSSRNSSWKLTWLSSSPPPRLCPSAHHRPHLHHNPAPHTIAPSLGFFDFTELISTWHFPLPVCSKMSTPWESGGIWGSFCSRLRN